MIIPDVQEHRAKQSLKRLLPRLEGRFRAAMEEPEWAGYTQRLRQHFPRLFSRLYELYGERYDFFYHLENIVSTATSAWIERPAELKALDGIRESHPFWYLSNRMLGAMGYVDRFAGNLAELRKRIPYLSELGITYLHLMPLFLCPAGENDGGYAVSDYRQVQPELGTMEELRELAVELRHHGISLVLDFVFNHTSDEHPWAMQALQGDPEYQEYYLMFDDRSMPDTYEAGMQAVFPQDHPGCFTYRNRIRKWVWTTFHTYQWDLNYENPEVFNAMAAEMLFLANQGVEVLRLDAVAFVWKRAGTTSQNLPEAHRIIQAYNALAKIAAPSLVFKSEAIVHPDEVARYIGLEECPISYNPALMALMWNALATREVRLLRHAMQKRFEIPDGCAWLNYIRCHDDIGWAFSDEDALELGIYPQHHRRFLLEFYTGRFPGSFARGLPFAEDPVTGDARISGTTASLSGLEKGLAEHDPTEIEMALRRIFMLHGVLYTIGGIPLLYLGDELGMLNDYAYEEDPGKLGDNRWTHRPLFDWETAKTRRDTDSLVGRIYYGMLRLAQLRTQTPAFRGGETDIIDCGNDHVFAYFRKHDDQSVLALANFSDREQEVPATLLRRHGLRKTFTDIVAGSSVTAMQKLVMEPYQFMVIAGVR
ncbi:MAG: alpha-glucosidase C-terminal domain-containing protein [Armatimonadetes bacterium]|nr:alpha-glucosidase C-terminal domain-containing protein [Armatimonadota bacterium]